VSNIEVNSGDSITIGGVQTQVQTATISQPSVNVSVTGVIGGASDAHYVHAQNENSETWTVEHNLNKYPSVMVIDSGNNVIYTEVQYLSINTLEIRFNGATSGKAYMK